ncbi:MAG: ABC transporter ATP-binding protein [Dehalococcoidia bacterium]
MPVLVRLLGFLRPYKLRTTVVILSSFLTGLFVLVMPSIVGWAIDNTNLKSGKFDKAGLVFAGAAILIASVMRGLFYYLQQYQGETLSQSVAYDLRNQIYDRLQRLSYAYHDKAQIGQIMSRATQDVEGVRFYINMGIIRLLYTLVLLIAALVLMLISNWRLAIATWAILPMIAIRSYYVSDKMRPMWTKVQDSMGRIGTVLQENLSGVRVVKSFGREDFESKKFRVEADDQFHWAFGTNRIQAFNQPLMIFLGSLTSVISIWYGGHLVASGSLQLGQLTEFLLYLQILQMPVRSLGFMITIFARAQSAGERIFEIIDAESAVKEKPGAVELAKVRGEVAFENVSFGYDSISPVLKEISFTTQPGEMIALLGPTGSGKSTVVNLMPRFYDVTGGRVLVDGQDIRDVTLSSLRQNIGIVQQDVFLFIDTIRENIRYGRLDATDEEVEQAAKVARIHDFILTLPDGYDTWVGERGVTLSGGQKQRISIARTLLLDPSILIFDDSTSSVDMETEYLIQQALGDLMRGRTTFVIAQRLRTVRRADEILVLRRGQVVERGRHEELLENNGLYRSIYDLELRDQEQAFERSREYEATRTSAEVAVAGD